HSGAIQARPAGSDTARRPRGCRSDFSLPSQAPTRLLRFRYDIQAPAGESSAAFWLRRTRSRGRSTGAAGHHAAHHPPPPHYVSSQEITRALLDANRTRPGPGGARGRPWLAQRGVLKTYDHAITKAELREVMASSVRQMLEDAPHDVASLQVLLGAR